MAPPASGASDAAPELDCSTGPVAKTYGGSDWWVYSCSDGLSVVVLSAQGSPAAPFYFMLQPTAGEIRLTGEGTGAKSATQPAYEALVQLSASDIAALVVETKQAQDAHKQKASADPQEK